jgi:hypothetical protein
MKIKVDIKSNCKMAENFHTIMILTISNNDYYILQNYDDSQYDDAWDRLCDQIEATAIPEALDPDWYIDHIDFN